MYAVAEVIAAAHGVVGDEYRLVHLGSDIYLGGLSYDTYHFIIYIVELNLLAYSRACAEEFFRDLLAYDAYFAEVYVVGLVDEAAFIDDGLEYLVVVLFDPCELGVGFLLAVERVGPLKHYR